MTVTDEMLKRAAQVFCDGGFEISLPSEGDLDDVERERYETLKAALTAALSDQAGEQHLVWSNQHRAWWRANSHGYTNDVRSAGLYDREEAISISGQGRDGWLEPKKAPDELAIPLSALPKNIRAMIAAAPPPSSTAGEGK